MMAKVIHNNLNAGGGAERLALVTIELLNEMGFTVDLETSERIQYRTLQKYFGHLNLHLRNIKRLVNQILSLKGGIYDVFPSIL
jgi:hypothetical protein